MWDFLQAGYPNSNTSLKEIASKRFSAKKPGDLSQDRVLVVSDRNVLVLGSTRDDLNQAANLRLVVERHAEEFCTFHSNLFTTSDLHETATYHSSPVFRVLLLFLSSE